MESDSRNFSYGGCEPSSSRMNRSMDQFVAIPQHSTLTQPRMATGGVNPLDLSSAIEHELRRVNSATQPWTQWSQQQQQQQQCNQLSSGGNNLLSHASSLDGDSTSLPIPYGSFLSQQQQQQQNSGEALGSSHQHSIPQYIPRFDEGLGQQIATRFNFTPESTESLGSARHSGFYSRSADGLPPSQQVFETAAARGDSSMRSGCSPWIERMMQADVTPTPTPINLCGLSSSVSCVASQTVDLQQSCHSSDYRPQHSVQSMRSAFSSEPQHDSTVELSADFCTDDEDLDTRPMDVKRKKRMLSNRASAQRSRQRRQERLDQLEVLTAKLRVENSTLQKKLHTAIQVAKKFDDQNKDLLKRVDRLSKELERGGSGKKARKSRKSIAANYNFNDCASSQQTACASSCEMVGEQRGLNPNLMRDGNGASTTPSMSPSSPGWPAGNSPPENDVVSTGNGAQISPIRKSFSACRMERKRSYDQSEDTSTAFGRSPVDMGSGSHSRARPPSPPPTGMSMGLGGFSPGSLEARPFWHEVCGHDGPSLKDDSVNVDCLEADRWLEFAECFL